MFWSEIEGCYVLYARHMVSDARIRSTARATSTDFLNWTEQTPMTFSDTDSATPSQHLYTNQTHPYFRAPHIYVSLPGRIHFNRSALTEAQSAEVCPGSGQRRRGGHLGWGPAEHRARAQRAMTSRSRRASSVRESVTTIGHRGQTIPRLGLYRPERVRCPCMFSGITINKRHTLIV